MTRRALALALLLAMPAAAADYPATPATFWGVITNSAKAPGDTVTLTVSGDYPNPNLYTARRAAPGVTVRPAAGVAARFPGLSISASEGFTFEGVEVAGGVAISGSNAITISGSKIAPTAYAAGVTVRRSTNIKVLNNELTNTGIGISFYDNPVGGLLAQGNHIHDIDGPDIIDVFSSSNVQLIGNTAHDVRPTAEAHPDFIQIDSPVAGGTRTANVLVKDNVYFVGVSPRTTPAQGIFAGHADNLTVTGNALWGTYQNGFSFSDVKTATLEDNFTSSQATVRGGSDSVTFTNNVAFSFQNYAPAGTPPNTNIALSGNRATGPTGSTEADFTAWRHRYDDPRDVKIAELTASLAMAVGERDAARAAAAAAEALSVARKALLASIAGLSTSPAAVGP